MIQISHGQNRRTPQNCVDFPGNTVSTQPEPPVPGVVPSYKDCGHPVSTLEPAPSSPVSSLHLTAREKIWVLPLDGFSASALQGITPDYSHTSEASLGTASKAMDEIHQGPHPQGSPCPSIHLLTHISYVTPWNFLTPTERVCVSTATASGNQGAGQGIRNPGVCDDFTHSVEMWKRHSG